MITVTARVDRARRLDVPVDAAWAFLKDVPAWAAIFPHAAAVRPYPAAGGAAFHWEMEPMGPPGRRVAVTYACRYHADDAARTLRWTPVEGVGTGRFTGFCTVAPSVDGGTMGAFELDAELRVPAPAFLRGVVEPLFQLEMTRVTERFLDRLGSAIPV